MFQVEISHRPIDLQPEVKDEVRQGLTVMEVLDEVGEEARPHDPGLNPDPPYDHLDVRVYEGPPTDLYWRVS